MILVISHMAVQKSEFYIFLGFILPAFNEAIPKDMFTTSLSSLDSSEIFLIMVFFYNVLVQFLKHQYNASMVATIV